jgi:phytoene dehydrogenase-like protein
MKDFDVIVIGSGIGGLISAGILTSRGLKTLVIERHITPGGYLASFKRKGFVFDSAVDCISGVAPGGLIYKALDLLRVSKNISFVRVDPVRKSIFPDIDVIVDAEVNVYIERLSTLFPQESGKIRKFFEAVNSVYNETLLATDMLIAGRLELNNVPPQILRFMAISYKDLLDEYFDDLRLKAILSDRCPFIGLPPSKVSALSMIAMIMSYFNLGAYRPAGGFQRLADVLADGIRKNGGAVILGNGAKKILLDGDNNCYGVRCDNDEEYTLRHVISNADFNYTFINLLGGKYAAIAEGMDKDIGISTSFFIVYAGIKGEVNAHSSVGYFPSYDMEGLFNSNVSFTDKSTIGITIATLEDKSRAPAGCHAVVIHEMVEASDRHLDKTQCTDIVLKRVERVIPGIKDRIMVLDSATPQTLQRYTGNFKGAAFGWRQIPGFRNMQRHDIKNLYIAGHWGDMGGGVLAAAYSGARAASEILAREGIRVDI